ncbi:MAG: hypothetical protein M1528_02770 [Candidatus Marsarchaeota archaeon]|nr:hypothetical protein [Candidatus Marsarchaeota archaeon]
MANYEVIFMEEQQKVERHDKGKWEKYKPWKELLGLELTIRAINHYARDKFGNESNLLIMTYQQRDGTEVETCGYLLKPFEKYELKVGDKIVVARGAIWSSGEKITYYPFMVNGKVTDAQDTYGRMRYYKVMQKPDGEKLIMYELDLIKLTTRT